jgi:hypothetical protein
MIDDKLIDNLKDIPVEDLIFIGNLADSLRYGKHSFYAKSKMLDVLRNQQYLSDWQRNVYTKLFYNFSELKGYYNIVNTVIKIINKSEKSFIENSVNNKQILCIPYNLLNKHEKIFQDTTFICENLQDNYFYLNISKWYIQNYIKGNVLTNFNFILGGGSTTAPVLAENLKNNKYPILCNLDSDKKHPSGAKGSTAKKVIKENKKFNNRNDICEEIKKLININILESREAENLIPLSIFVELNKINGNEEKEKFIKMFNKVISTNNTDLLLYLDVKKGMKKSRYKQITNLDEKKLINKILKIIDWDENSISDLNNFDLENKDTPLDTKIIPGFGDNVLENTKTFLNKNDLKKIKIPLYLEGLWKNLAISYVDWGICCKKIYN